MLDVKYAAKVFVLMILFCSFSSCGQDVLEGNESTDSEDHLFSIAISESYQVYYTKFRKYLSISRGLSPGDLSAISAASDQFTFENIFDHEEALAFITSNAPSAIDYYKYLYATDKAFDELEKKYSVKSLSGEKWSRIRTLYKEKILGSDFHYDALELEEILKNSTDSKIDNN